MAEFHASGPNRSNGTAHQAENRSARRVARTIVKRPWRRQWCRFCTKDLSVSIRFLERYCNPSVGHSKLSSTRPVGLESPPAGQGEAPGLTEEQERARSQAPTTMGSMEAPSQDFMAWCATCQRLGHGAVMSTERAPHSVRNTHQARLSSSSHRGRCQWNHASRSEECGLSGRCLSGQLRLVVVGSGVVGYESRFENCKATASHKSWLHVLKQGMLIRKRSTSGTIGQKLTENGRAEANRAEGGQRPPSKTRNLMWVETR